MMEIFVYSKHKYYTEHVKYFCLELVEVDKKQRSPTVHTKRGRKLHDVDTDP